MKLQSEKNNVKSFDIIIIFSFDSNGQAYMRYIVELMWLQLPHELFA